MRRRIVAVLVPACVALACAALPACAPDPAAQQAAAVAELDRITDTRTDADVVFVRDMVPHHAQGVELAGLVAARTTSLPVRDMAFRITRAQGQEIGQLRGYLAAWGVDAGDGGAADAMGGMSGMVDPSRMAAIRDARGPAFDRLWLAAMIAHHEGAVAMAETELRGGVNLGARNTATNVISVQQAEIATMRALLAA